MKKFGFCKWLLIADYLILLMLMGVFAAMSFREADTANLAIVIGAWIAQLGISSGAYYWKAKAENLVKLPLYMFDELPEDRFQSTAPVWEPTRSPARSLFMMKISIHGSRVGADIE